MSPQQVAKILDEIGTMLEVRDENPFKCRAYHNAAKIISSLTQDLEAIINAGELRNVKGIGPALTEKITELVKTGALAYYTELRQSMPSGFSDLLRIEGLGPKKINLLFKQLNIQTIAELKKAAEEHRLASIPGFGKKTEENILQGITRLEKNVDKHLYPKARTAAERICKTIKSIKGVTACEIAGSLRRLKEVIGDIDIVVCARPDSKARIMDAFTSHPDVETIIARGETKSSVRLSSGINCDLRVVDSGEYPFALAYFTGSKDHNIGMRTLAKKFGWSLNEYGFSKIGSDEKRGKAKQAVKCKSETELYQAVGLAYIPPELRENMGEIEIAAAGSLPTLVSYDDLRGTFHCHTDYSDGSATLEQMADAAIVQGWKYLGIADHSKIAAYAGGLTEGAVRDQHKEIDRLNGKFRGFRLFKGTEADILPDGTLDWSEKLLASFDYVVASIHSKFKMTEEEATKRLIMAIKNKHVTMIGHPTGRLLLQRDGYPVNLIDVINAAGDYGKIIEINSHPERLDLDWRFCKVAKEKGVMLSINPDAHSIEGLFDVRYGINIARKGWLGPRDILNTRSTEEVENIFKMKK